MKLTPDEIRERGQSLAEACSKLVELDHAKKTIAKESADAVKSQEAVVLKLTRIVQAREEERPVECIEVFNVNERVVETMRMDTRAIVATRPMSVAEFHEQEQKRLPFGKPSSTHEGEGEPAGEDERKSKKKAAASA